MSPWLESWIAKYGAILLGVVIGTSAKYGLTLVEGRKVTTRMIVADALLIGMVVLVARTVVVRLGLSDADAAMIAALFAVSSDRVIRLIRERFLRRVDAEARSIAAEQVGLARQVVQAEQSASNIIEDTLTGRAPDEYVALRPHPSPDDL
ncbi:hypothetical protein [Sphingomonas sp. DBB INV C78]|uniref:hypothetical protein n=1 Tax=Sphingomonas sp. DBB INV C78 TaxID=3349434 RepID=UPI0036D3E7A1